MRRRAALTALTALPLASCGLVSAVAPTFIAVLDLVDYFTRQLDLVAAKVFEDDEDVMRAIGVAKNVLATIRGIVQGADKLDRDRVAEAFAEFQKAYDALYTLLVRGGLVEGNGALFGHGSVSAPIDTPNDVHLRVSRLQL